MVTRDCHAPKITKKHLIFFKPVSYIPSLMKPYNFCLMNRLNVWIGSYIVVFGSFEVPVTFKRAKEHSAILCGLQKKENHKDLKQHKCNNSKLKD